MDANLDPASGSRQEDIEAERLVQRFKAGETDAYGELYTRYFKRVYNYLRLVLSTPETAEDAAQQSFLNAFVALERFDPSRTPFRGWLFAIVRNQAITELRRERKVEPMDPDELAELAERKGAVEPEEEALRTLHWLTDPDLIAFVERLTLPQRQVLLLRYMLDLTYDDIGSILGRTSADVRKLHQRAQDFLRDRLTALGRRYERPESPDPMRATRPHQRILRRRRFALDP